MRVSTCTHMCSYHVSVSRAAAGHVPTRGSIHPDGGSLNMLARMQAEEQASLDAHAFMHACMHGCRLRHCIQPLKSLEDPCGPSACSPTRCVDCPVTLAASAVLLHFAICCVIRVQKLTPRSILYSYCQARFARFG